MFTVRFPEHYDVTLLGRSEAIFNMFNIYISIEIKFLIFSYNYLTMYLSSPLADES